MITSTMKSFLIYLFHKHLNYIITVPAVHRPIKLQYLYFELILGDFAQALFEVSFGTIFCNPLETNHLKKCLEKHFCAGTLLNTNETLSLLLFFFLFCHFLYFSLKISSPWLYITLRGTILVYLDVTLSSRSIYNVIQFKCCSLCSMYFFLCKSLSDTMLYHVIFT